MVAPQWMDCLVTSFVPRLRLERTPPSRLCLSVRVFELPVSPGKSGLPPACDFLVPKLCLGTHCNRGSASARCRVSKSPPSPGKSDPPRACNLTHSATSNLLQPLRGTPPSMAGPHCPSNFVEKRGTGSELHSEISAKTRCREVRVPF